MASNHLRKNKPVKRSVIQITTLEDPKKRRDSCINFRFPLCNKFQKLINLTVHGENSEALSGSNFEIGNGRNGQFTARIATLEKNEVEITQIHPPLEEETACPQNIQQETGCAENGIPPEILPIPFRKKRTCSLSSAHVDPGSSPSSPEEEILPTKSLDITSLTSEELEQSAWRSNSFWLIKVSMLTSSYILSINEAFLMKGQQMRQLHIQFESALMEKRNVLACVTFMLIGVNINELILDYYCEDQVVFFIQAISNQYKQGKLSKLEYLELNCDQPSVGLSWRGVDALTFSDIPWKIIKINQFQPNNERKELSSSLEKLLDKHKDKMIFLRLGRLHATAASENEVDARLQIRIPEMSNLRTLEISTDWDGIVDKEDEETDDCFQVELNGNFPQLEYLSLGQFVEIQEIPYMLIAKLKTFCCESPWNLNTKFPSIPSLDSKLTELVFPLALEDTSFVAKVSKFFPNLKNVELNCPSQAVLRSFFQHFSSSTKLQKLRITFNYLFPNMMESCLFPKSFEISAETQDKLNIIKSYKWYKEFCANFFFELPLEDCNTKAKGIEALKYLKTFVIHYEWREPLKIPILFEKRRWSDSSCKFYEDKLIGFPKETGYPISDQCCKAILSRFDKVMWNNDLPNFEKFKSPRLSALSEEELDSP